MPLNHHNTHSLAQGYEKLRGGEGKRPEMRGWQERGTESGFTTLADAGGASAHHGVRGGLTAL